MGTVIVTGSAGLIGSETVKRFAKEGTRVVGIDNDMRARFFGPEATVNCQIQQSGFHCSIT
jgi:CDP-paratose 2-epimerase